MLKWLNTIIVGSKCHCCGNDGERYTTLGHRRAVLCDVHVNEFHAWLIAQDAFKNYHKHKAVREYLDGQVAGRAYVSQEQWDDCYAEQQRLEDELFRITGEWLEENKQVEEIITTAGDTVHAPMSEPHKCPVCDGKGWTPGPVPTDDATMMCRACNGTGIVWSSPYGSAVVYDGSLPYPPTTTSTPPVTT